MWLRQQDGVWVKVHQRAKTARMVSLRLHVLLHHPPLPRAYRPAATDRRGGRHAFSSRASSRACDGPSPAAGAGTTARPATAANARASAAAARPVPFSPCSSSEAQPRGDWRGVAVGDRQRLCTASRAAGGFGGL